MSSINNSAISVHNKVEEARKQQLEESNMAIELEKGSSSQEKYGKVQLAIRMLVLVLFLGWIFIWIMTPTKTYKQTWKPQLLAKTSSTYFGVQGLFFDSTIYAKFIFCVYILLVNTCLIIQ